MAANLKFVLAVVFFYLNGLHYDDDAQKSLNVLQNIYWIYWIYLTAISHQQARLRNTRGHELQNFFECCCCKVNLRWKVNISMRYWERESLGLVVMGEDSCSKGCEFESQHRILDGHFNIYLL